MSRSIFLTARWKYLIMANYVVDPTILEPYVPPGTELDFWQGHTYVSLVGFLFLDTKVLGMSIPRHRDFEEVNLRFYVRYREADDWKRGVVFVKEIVPRRAIAWVANLLYGEPYVRMPMRHRLDRKSDQFGAGYSWKYRGSWNYISVEAAPDPVLAEPGSEAEFITEHYWGYTRVDERHTRTYQVEHPSWRIFPVHQCEVRCDVANLYGPEFEPYVQGAPASVFMAEGSEVTVRQGSLLTV